MKRALYYHFILSGFTRVKVLLKDCISSRPEIDNTATNFVSKSVKKKKNANRLTRQISKKKKVSSRWREPQLQDTKIVCFHLFF